jgi:Protein of unknown function (DUF3999)
MWRAIAALLLAATLCMLMLSADLPDEWRAWRYSRAIEAQPADGPAWLSLPWDIYVHCRGGCDDVRIVNTRGDEVPFVLQERHTPSNTESRAARILEHSFVAGHYTQVIADLGEGHLNYDRVKVETNRPNFIVWAEVALSDDSRTWRIVETRAPIARFRSRVVDGTQTIPIQGLSSRYVRVRISDPSEQFPVNGITVLHQETYKFQTKDIPAAFAEENSTDRTESVWRTALASTNQPVSQVEIKTDSPEFYRAVRVSSSVDGKEWTYCGSGVIYRYKHDSASTRESLRIEFPEIIGNRFVRVEVVNGNDRPLTNLGLALAAVPRTLVFKQTAGQEYSLIYGNERAGRPQYDLGRYLEVGPSKQIPLAVALGPEQKNENYRDPRPFTERHPEVLWSALAVAAILIGLTALKTLRSPAGSAPRDRQGV